jgi:hypothetical protein
LLTARRAPAVKDASQMRMGMAILSPRSKSLLWHAHHEWIVDAPFLP